MFRLSTIGIIFLVSLVCILYGLVKLYTTYETNRHQPQPLDSSPLYNPTSPLWELQQIAKFQIEPWIGFQMNKSDVKDYAKRKAYLYVLEINNGTVHIPEYIDKEFEYNANVEPLISVIQQILLEDNAIQDTVLFLNLLDEPRNPNKTRCQETKTWDKIAQYHGLPLSFLETEQDIPWFPILSPATISNCFHDILVPFGDILEPNKLAEMSNTNRTVCEWQNKSRLYTAIFRGSLTGHSVQQGRNHRLALIDACDNVSSRYLRNYLANSSLYDKNWQSLFPDGGPLCDAALSQSVELENKEMNSISSSSYFLPMSAWEQITYFVLDIDGNSYSRRLAYLCFADVDIIRLGIFEDLLLQLLKNGTHYRHIQMDSSDLFSTLRYMRNNLTYSQQLCRNKQQRCQQVLAYENMKYYVKTLLEEYSRQVAFV